jgi:hypothetical protein
MYRTNRLILAVFLMMVLVPAAGAMPAGAGELVEVKEFQVQGRPWAVVVEKISQEVASNYKIKFFELKEKVGEARDPGRWQGAPQFSHVFETVMEVSLLIVPDLFGHHNDAVVAQVEEGGSGGYFGWHVFGAPEGRLKLVFQRDSVYAGRLEIQGRTFIEWSSSKRKPFIWDPTAGTMVAYKPPRPTIKEKGVEFAIPRENQVTLKGVGLTLKRLGPRKYLATLEAGDTFALVRTDDNDFNERLMFFSPAEWLVETQPLVWLATRPGTVELSILPGYAEWEHAAVIVLQFRPLSFAEAWRRGDAWAGCGDLERALVYYNLAAAQNPRHTGLLLRRAEIHAAKKDWGAALKDYSDIIAIDARHAMTYQKRGDIYVAQREYAKALADYSRALELTPADYHLHKKKINLLFEMGEYWQGLTAILSLIIAWLQSLFR